MYLSNDETSFALHIFIHFIILRIKSKFSFESNTSRSQFPPCFRLIILMIIRQNQIKCACFKFSMENSPFDLFSNPSSNRWKGMERSMTRRNKRSGRGMKIRLKGRREKGLYFCFRLDDKIKATFDRDSKSSRNVPQLCYALTIGIFFFFSFTQLLCTLPRDRRFFDCTNFTWKHRGTEERRETWSGKRSTTRTSLLRYLSIFHFEFYSIIGGVRARVAATTTWISIIRIARGELPRSWQVHRWWLNR